MQFWRTHLGTRVPPAALDTTQISPQETTTLLPSYRIPIGLGAIALGITGLSPWVGGPIILFALFLAYQAATLRLTFTKTTLQVFRGQTQIRDFPYTDWATWEIFWAPVPILFYFREVKSIHFLPVLFQPSGLRQALECYIPLNPASEDPEQA